MAWLDPWGIRQKVKVTNNTGRYLYNYQILIELTSSNFDFENCKSDGSDIRFTESDGVTKLPFWIEKWDSEEKYARVWIRIFALPPLDSHIYLYYSNPEAESESNGKLTFKFFDDFESDLNWESEWQSNNHALYSTENGVLKLLNGGSTYSDCLNSQYQFKNGFAIEARVKTVGSEPCETYLNFEPSPALMNHKDYVRFRIQDRIITSIGGNDERTSTDYSVSDVWYRAILKMPSTGDASAEAYEDGTLLVSKTGTPTNRAGYIALFQRPSSTGYVDWIFVRKYIDPEPFTKLDKVEIKKFSVTFKFEVSSLLEGEQGGKKFLSVWEDITSSISSSFYCSTEFLQNVNSEIGSTFRFSPLPPPPYPYTFRFPIFVENNTTNTLYDFQIPIEINSSNFDYTCCNEYGSDINFYNDDYSQELPFWWEEWEYNDTSKVWIKVPEIPPGFHLCAILVCGHSKWEYVRPEQPKEVFLFYDGFECSDVSSWTFEFSPSDSGEPYYGVADACHGDYELKAGFSENCDNPHVTIKQTVSLPPGEKVLNCWQKETNTGVSPTHAIYINDVEKWSDVADSEYSNCVFIQTSSFTDSGNVEIKFTDSKDQNTKVGIRLDSIFIRKYIEPFPTATLLGKDSLIFRVYRDFQLDCLFPLEDFKKNNTIMVSGRLESFPLSELSFSCSQNGTLPVSSYVPAYLKSNNFLLIPGSWKRKRNITIENNTGQTLTDYQICLTLTPENFDYENCRLDGGDLRFTNPSLKLLPYWIERWEYNGTSRIWVKVDEIPTGSNICLFMFYDNPLATSESNIKTTFILGDDFMDDAQWISSHPSKMNIKNGLLNFGTFDNYEYQAYLSTKNALDIPDSFFIQFKCKIKNFLNPFTISYIGVSDEVPNTTNLVAFQPFYNDYAYYLSVKDDGEDHKDKMYAPGGDNEKLQEMFSDDCWHGVRIWKEGNTIHGEIWNGDFTEQIGYVEPGGEREGRITDVNPSGLKKFVILNQAPSPDDKEFGYEGCLDDLIVAKYATPEPVVTLGEPQHVIIHDSYCYSESKTDFRLNSSYLIGETFSLLPLLSPVGSTGNYLSFGLEVNPDIDGFSVPVLEYLLHADISMEEPNVQKKLWLSEALSQPIDIYSNFLISTNLSVVPELEFTGLPAVHWLINGGNVSDLISFKVVQEWAAPDIAELRFKGLPHFKAGDDIHIVETPCGAYPQVTLFRGPILSVDKELVRGREETVIRAVSNEWYLTKQNCFWGIESSLYSLDPHLTTRTLISMWLGSWGQERRYSYVPWLCLWSRIPDPFKTICQTWKNQRGWGDVEFFMGDETDWWNAFYEWAVGSNWRYISGVCPLYFDEVPDWQTKYVERSGRSGFNFFYGTTKWDGIMQICNVCDCVFYCVYWDKEANNPYADYGPQEEYLYGPFEDGRRLAVFLTKETAENQVKIEIPVHDEIHLGHPPGGQNQWMYLYNPLARDAVLMVDDDWEHGNYLSKLISIRTREEGSSEDTKINRLAVTSQDFPVVTAEKYKHLERKPVEEFIAINNIDIEDLQDLESFAEERLEELRKPNVTFEARFLSLVVYESSRYEFEFPSRIPLHTGMYIGFDGIEGLPPSSDEDGYYRVMKITYERGEQTGGRLITTLECRDTDLIHPGSPKLNEIENIMHREAKKIEKGPILPGHPCPSNPRPPMLGEIPWIEIGEIVNYNAEEQTVDVKIYRTGQIVKGIPLL